MNDYIDEDVLSKIDDLENNLESADDECTELVNRLQALDLERHQVSLQLEKRQAKRTLIEHKLQKIKKGLPNGDDE
ncbi:MAG: hypothetical protein Q7R33_01650 [Nitrosarchaeum sp.]|nr:hypothetical protein [Nitrosarchaeum sp.]